MWSNLCLVWPIFASHASQSWALGSSPPRALFGQPAAKMASSSHIAPAVVGGEVWTLERIRQEAVPADARQQWAENNNLIKYARWRHENPIGCPTVEEVMIDMHEATFEVIECEHGKGEVYTFQGDGPTHPWSWRAFVNAMKPQEAELVVGPGLVAISLYNRPGTYDHHRAHAANKHGHEDLQHCNYRPPIWDFRFYRSDGSSMLVHPRRQKKQKMDITSLADCPDGPVMPKAGSGKSDGKGTYRRVTEAAYPRVGQPSSSSLPPPSPPGGPTQIQTGPAPPPPWAPPPQMAPALSVGGQAATMPVRIKAPPVWWSHGLSCVPPNPVTPTVQAVEPAAHPAFPDLQDGRWDGLPTSMAAAKAAAPAAPPPICHGQVADAGCGAAFDVKAGVPTPKTWASPANAACPDTKSPWTHWGGNWWKNEQGGWKKTATSP
jgi:hypothetical protein